MVFPLYDDNTGRWRTPFVTYLLIAINVLVFVLPQGMGANAKFTYAFSTVPQEIATGRDVDEPVVVQHPITQQPIARIEHERLPPFIPVYVTLLTSMFMHGGLLHLLGNMWFLWIFGDNVEDDLGHARYVIFYLICGVLAALAHVASTFAFNGNPYIPSLARPGRFPESWAVTSCCTRTGK